MLRFKSILIKIKKIIVNYRIVKSIFLPLYKDFFLYIEKFETFLGKELGFY